jgi:hypothetical protein
MEELLDFSSMHRPLFKGYTQLINHLRFRTDIEITIIKESPDRVPMVEQFTYRIIDDE